MPNIFAIECLMDELADEARQDPVEYRLSLLADQRARGVIWHVAQMAQWRANEPIGAGKARGIAFSRYKNRAAYAAVVAEVEVDEAVRALRM